MECSKTVRRLNRRLSRVLTRLLCAYVTSRTDGRPYRQPDYLAQACRYLESYLRISRKMARAEPHLFGPHAVRYYRDTVEQARRDTELELALDKIYGLEAPEHRSASLEAWRERYVELPKWKHFRKWFRENYGG